MDFVTKIQWLDKKQPEECSMCTNCCHPKMVFSVYKLLSPENGVQYIQIVVTRK